MGREMDFNAVSLQPGSTARSLIVFFCDHAVAGAGLACTPSLGPIVVMAIGRLAVRNRVNTGLAYVFGVFAGHRHKV